MSARLMAKLVGAEFADWKGREVNEKAAQLQDAVSKVKNSMLTWHADTPQVRPQCVLTSFGWPGWLGGMRRRVACAGRQTGAVRSLGVPTGRLHTWHPSMHPPLPVSLQAVAAAVELHLAKQLGSDPSAAEQLRARETAVWFEKCVRSC